MSAAVSIAHAVLDDREAIIAGALRTFVEAGRALGEIRDQSLYVERGFRTFDIYCKERWDMRGDQADRAIRCAAVAARIQANWPEIGPPANEAQARPLTLLAEEDQVAVWVEIVATAPNGKVSARHAESVVRSHLPPPAEPDPDPFHLLVGIGDLRAKLRAWVAEWPAEARAKSLPTVLRDFADEYEGGE